MNRYSFARVAGLAGLALALTGCAAPPKTLYGWGGYQTSVYQYLKADGLDVSAQIEGLEAQIAANKAGGRADPPGLHGHLALLYGKTGNQSAAENQLSIERGLFPESATYVDFLLKRAAQAAQKKEAGNG